MKRLVLLSALFIVGCQQPYECNEKVSIAKVGGCNKIGECGVLLSNGAKHTLMFPVEGQKLIRCTNGENFRFKRDEK